MPEITQIPTGYTTSTAAIAVEGSLVFLLDIKGRIKYVNTAAQAATGFTAAEIENCCFSELFLPADEKELLPLGQGNVPAARQYQTHITCKNGNRKIINWHCNTIKHAGEPEYIFITGTETASINKTETAEDENIQQLNTIFENAPDAVIVMDENGIITRWNQQAVRIFGWEAGEVAGKSLQEVLVPEAAKHKTYAGFGQFMHTGPGDADNRQIEICALCKDGRETDLSISISPIILNNGLAFIAFIRDITAQKAASRALEQKTQQLDEAQRIAHIGSWEWDIAKNKITWSDELYSIFGLRPDDFPGDFESYLEIVHTDEKEAIRKIIEEAFGKREPFAFEHRVIRKDGSIRFIYSKGNITSDENNTPVRMTGIAQDITDFKNTQDILQLTQFSVDKASDGVLWADENARFTYVNETACRLFDYTRDELMQMHVYDLEISPNAKMNWPGFWNELKKKKSAIVESMVRRKDGTVFPLEINTNFLDYKGREIKVSYVRDITERRRNEEKLKAVNNDLSTFIYRSTHDLKAPLASITGLISLAKEEVTDQQAGTYLKMIGECTENLDSVLQLLIQAMAVKDNQPQPTLINFNKLVYNVLMRLKYNKGYNEVDVDVYISADNFYSDESLLASILQNLTENAIKYKNNRQPHQFIKINIQQHGSNLTLSVEDNGIGIDEKQQDKIFDLFYRAATGFKGFGLGLYIVKSAVEKLQGKVSVKSAAGMGTTISIGIPSLPLKN